ncbi:MAG: RDD family protein [Clostridia bacterium]|nr:RDD family protein [Clostridia bacterium]
MQNGGVFERRIVAFFIDLFITCAVCAVLMLAGELLFVPYSKLIAMAIAVMLIICRDAFGTSPGKIMMRLCVIDTRTNKHAAVHQRILRNISTPLWMIEALICYLKKGLRMTDMWLGTKVVSDMDLSNQ